MGDWASEPDWSTHVVDQAPIRQLPLLQGVWGQEEGKRCKDKSCEVEKSNDILHSQRLDTRPGDYGRCAPANTWLVFPFQ